MIKILCMNVDALPEACAQCYKVIPSWDLVKLNKAVQMGLLFKIGRHHYSATPELLQLWIEKGVLI